LSNSDKNNSIDNSYLLSDRANEDHQKLHRKHIRSIILILDDKIEYDRIKDLADLVRYRSKLMACYGFDVKSGKWDTTRFPVTKTDAQMEGIQSDIQRYNDAVQRYNEYAEYLATPPKQEIVDSGNNSRLVPIYILLLPLRLQ
jgi:hypothetical protein